MGAGPRDWRTRQESREQGSLSKAQKHSRASLPGQKGRINPHEGVPAGDGVDEDSPAVEM